MTKKELNVAIKKLEKNIKNMTREEASKEFTMLLDAEKTMQALTADSMRIMLNLFEKIKRKRPLAREV